MCRSVTKDLHDHSVQLNRWFLKPIGAWPQEPTTSNSEKAVSRILIFICYFLIAFTVIPCALNVFFEEKDVELKLRAAGPLSHWFMGGLNYCSLLLRSADIRKCMQHMEMDWRIMKQSRDREIMTRNAKLGRFVAGFCAICMHGGVFSYNIVSGMTTVMVSIGDNQSVSMLQLPCAFYNKLIDTRYSPANEIVLMTQMLSGFIVNSTTVSACSLAAVFAIHACGQLDILILRLGKLVEGEDAEKNESVHRRLTNIVNHHLRVLRFIGCIEDVMHQICLVELLGCTFNLCMLGYYSITLDMLFSWLNDLVDEEGNESAEQRLAIIVEHHLRVLSFISRMETIMQQICLVELLGCTLNMCLLAYYFITNMDSFDMAKTISYVIIYLSVAFNIFIFCYIGEILTEQCKNVGERVYMINWYELPHKTALGLILVITRSSNVIKITAGKLFQLSIATFGDSGTFLFTVAKAMTSMNVMIGNETISVHPMTCPIYSKFIDTRFSPANEIMLAVELLSCFIVNSITVGACSLAAVFAMHAYGQLSMLFAWLNDLVEDEDNRNNFAEKKLATIVEHHLRVLSFISRMENVMQNICLVELVGCTMNMCLLAYYSITNWSNFDAARITSYIIVYVSMAFNIFIFCYIGEILTEQCKNVGEKAYMTNWYELPHKTALGLILIIARSSNVIKITAGKLFQLSIATFGDVSKTDIVFIMTLGWNVIERTTSVAYMIIYLSMTFNVFIFCYIGEIVTEQCKQVGEAVYMTNWYRLPHKTARGLILIISQSSCVIKLTAGKLVHLSIATFGDVSISSVCFIYYVFYSQIYVQNILGDENLHDISKHASDYNSFLDNNSYTILYKALAIF
ncbi:OR4 protein, partial [Acromyrmex heyeri]